MCRKTNDPTPSAKKSSSSFLTKLSNCVTIIYMLGFFNFRVAQVFGLASSYPMEVLTSVLAFLIMSKVTPLPWNFMVVLGMVTLVYITDDYVLGPIPKPKPGTVVAITGANSGVGLETAMALAQYSSVIVVMACRSISKCQGAAESIRDSQGTPRINVIPMQLDLSSFDSVYQFADSLKQTIGKPVDVLFNNAGYSPPMHEPVNQYGLAPSITSMHLSHHLLAELLVEWNLRLRLVATSSITHHMCAFTAVLPRVVMSGLPLSPGCITEDYFSKPISGTVSTYSAAKGANVMHVSEFPLRHPMSSAVAIDLGFVGTSLLPGMSGQFSATSIGWMRSANVGIHPILQAILQPYKEREWATHGGLTVGVLGRTREPFSGAPWWTGDVSAEKMKQRSKQLWKTSTEILQKYGCTVCQ